MGEKQFRVNPKRLDNQGITIIEIMFALSIFAIGILAVSTLAITSVNANASSRMVTEATTLAEVRLEQLMSLPYDVIEIGPNSTTQGAYEVSWDVQQDVIAEQTKSVTVTVTRPGGLKETKVVIRYLISKNG
jgi:Tfp pilus assembly protein PilV